MVVATSLMGGHSCSVAHRRAPSMVEGSALWWQQVQRTTGRPSVSCCSPVMVKETMMLTSPPLPEQL